MKKNLTNYRWRVAGLLFFATTLNYLDRQILSILKPYISGDLGWDETDYANIVTAFQLAYGLGLLLTSAWLDSVGTKKGYGIAVSVWSFACIGHAFVRSVFGFGAARVFLGLGESANFPSAIKSVTEWFPKKERAFATGLFNAGSNIGALLTPVIVAVVTVSFGWRMTFVVTGGLGVIWLILWVLTYQLPQNHSKVSKQELDYILSDNQKVEIIKTSWLKLISNKMALALCIIKTLTDWVWWLLLFWTPDFLEKMFVVNIKELTIPLVVIYTFASVGGIFGGWLSSNLIKKGRTIDYSRKSVMLLMAVLMLNLAFLPLSGSIMVAVVFLSLSTAAHQGWSSNLFTLISDIFPRNRVGAVTSLAGFTASIGGALSAFLIGILLEKTQSYILVFAIAASMYVVAWFVLRLMVPKIKTIHTV